MRLVATTTEDNVILSFTGDGGPESLSLRNEELTNLTVPEAMVLLLDKLDKIVYGEPVGYEPDYEYVKTPREYLKDVGAL